MNIQAVGLGQAPQPELRGSPAARKTEPQKPVQLPKVEASAQQLQLAVQKINSKLSSTSLEFTFDKGTKQTIVKVMDKESGEVIRQIPSDAALAIAESIGEFQKGLLLKQEA